MYSTKIFVWSKIFGCGSLAHEVDQRIERQTSAWQQWRGDGLGLETCKMRTWWWLTCAGAAGGELGTFLVQPPCVGAGAG